MVELLQAVVASQGFEPHGYCFLWTPPLLWLYIVSDSLIALSYYSISIALIHFVRKRRDIAFNWAFLMFAVFIIACGTTHIMALWTLWNPLYWLDGAVKAVTAAVSLAAAIALWPLIPKALALPSPAQLETANLALQGEILERSQAQEALRRAHDDLEIRVHERTKELARAAEALQAEIAERRRVEDRLRLQGAALEAAANAIVITDREGRITWANPAFTRLTGYGVEEVLGGNPRILNSGRHDRSFYRELWETILSGRVWHAEMINRRKDGRLYFEEQTITPVPDERGDITHFIAIKQDVSERRRAEEALQESEERYRDLVENSEDLICTHDLEGKLLSVNRAVVRGLRYEHTEDILGRKISDFLVPDTRDSFNTYLDTVVTEGHAHGFMKVLTRSGEERILEYRNSLRREGLGQPIVRGTAHDVTESLRAEEELRASQERYRSLVENASICIYEINCAGRVISMNPAGLKMMGATDESQVHGMAYLDAVSPADRPRVGDLLGRALAGESSEFEFVAANEGEPPIFASCFIPLKSKKGTVHKLMGITQDITERKRAEVALRESKERYRDLVENANDIIYTHDLAGNFTSLNRAGERISGYTRGEALMMNLSHVVAPEHLDLARQMVASKLEEIGPTMYELEIIAKDGHRVPLEVSTRLIYQDRTAVGVQGIGRDITERKRAEETLRSLYRASLEIQEPLGLQERLDRLLQTAQTVLELDRVNILLADPEEQWLQAVASLGVEEPLEAIRVPIGPEGGGLAKAFRTREAVLWDGRNPVPASLRLQPPFDQIKALRSRAFVAVPLVVQGRAIGVLGADRRQSRRPFDAATPEMLQLFVTQAALAIEQARLYEAQRMAAIQLEARVEDRTRDLQEAMLLVEAGSKHKSEFLANMSHELRTPLNSILGFSDLLRDQQVGPLTEKQARYVRNIRESGRHLLTLINDLLDLSKVEAGKLELRPQAFDLREAIEAALTEVRPQTLAKALGFTLHVDESLSLLTADPVRFRQILLNLFSNAIKFTPDGGRITVTARRVPSSRLQAETTIPGTRNPEPGTASGSEVVEIAVADTGVGIKPEDLPKLFQPFTQLEGSFAKQYHGTGLGLALTKRLVEAHGGTVRAESEGEGRGSTFTIRLPLTSPA